MHALEDTMLCKFWEILIAYSFYKLHISPVVVHINMVNAHLTSWDGLMNVLDNIFNVRVFLLHMELLSFLQMSKDKFPLRICDFMIWEVLI